MYKHKRLKRLKRARIDWDELDETEGGSKQCAYCSVLFNEQERWLYNRKHGPTLCPPPEEHDSEEEQSEEEQGQVAHGQTTDGSPVGSLHGGGFANEQGADSMARSSDSAGHSSASGADAADAGMAESDAPGDPKRYEA